MSGSILTVYLNSGIPLGWYNVTVIATDPYGNTATTYWTLQAYQIPTCIGTLQVWNLAAPLTINLAALCTPSANSNSFVYSLTSTANELSSIVTSSISGSNLILTSSTACFSTNTTLVNYVYVIASDGYASSAPLASLVQINIANSMGISATNHTFTTTTLANFAVNYPLIFVITTSNYISLNTGSLSSACPAATISNSNATLASYTYTCPSSGQTATYSTACSAPTITSTATTLGLHSSSQNDFLHPFTFVVKLTLKTGTQTTNVWHTFIHQTAE